MATHYTELEATYMGTESETAGGDITEDNSGNDDAHTDRMRNLALKEDSPQVIPKCELECEFIHPSIFINGGVLVNFINHNSPDSATVIGSIRLKTSEIQRVPRLLSQYYQSVKAHAAYALQKHLEMTQSTLGVDEVITLDDFSLTFMLSSVSDEAKRHHPYGRNEGPLYYCLFSEYTRLSTIGYTIDNKPATCYLINAYIHLNEAAKRRNAVLKKKRSAEEKPQIKKEKDEPESYKNQQPGPSAAKKFKYQKKAPQTQPELTAMQDSISRIEKQVTKLNLPGKSAYPAMPTAPAFTWPTPDAMPPMPEGL